MEHYIFDMAKYPTYVDKKVNMSELVPALPVEEMAGNSNFLQLYSTQMPFLLI